MVQARGGARGRRRCGRRALGGERPAAAPAGRPRARAQTLASPLSGILGDRYDRVLVLASGAFIWGIMTSAMALTAMAFAGFNGIGLALLVPCCQSLVADLHPPEQRGRAFGTLQLTASLGGMMGGVFATNMGGLSPWGMEGWRAAFHCIAALSLAVGALALAFAVDPRRVPGAYALLPATDVSVSALLAGSPPRPATPALPQPPPPPSPLPSPLPGGAAPAHPGVGAVSGALERRRSFHRSPGASGAAPAWIDPAGSWAAGVAEGGQPVAGRGGEQLLLPPHPKLEHHRGRHGQHEQQQQQDVAPLSDQQQQQQQQPHHRERPRIRALSPGGGSSWAAECGGPPSAPKGSGGGDAALDVRGLDKAPPRPRRRGVVADICWMLRIRTFQAIVLQGIVGCFPWQAIVFFTLWLQLNGFSDSTASLLVATFGAGVAGGALLGGAVGDRMARRLPNSGRIYTAQFSVACGIPLTWLLLHGLPRSAWAGAAPAYAAVLFVAGLTCTWAGAGCNSPIFAEIVPDELRSTIYAFDRSFENSIAACAAPVVGLLAERVFGFTGALGEAALRDPALRARNAAALGSSLLACMALPWALCLVAYSLLHWVYPRDRAAARAWGGGGEPAGHHAAAACH
ncbi:hypothetical protein HT031_000314 [Scenedesmus sp. PABB004]|nr:hypothetical protein HT031_000314 [Scenedesmus sp. PABB004]